MRCRIYREKALPGLYGMFCRERFVIIIMCLLSLLKIFYNGNAELLKHEILSERSGFMSLTREAVVICG